MATPREVSVYSQLPSMVKNTLPSEEGDTVSLTPFERSQRKWFLLVLPQEPTDSLPRHICNGLFGWYFGLACTSHLWLQEEKRTEQINSSLHKTPRWVCCRYNPDASLSIFTLLIGNLAWKDFSSKPGPDLDLQSDPGEATLLQRAAVFFFQKMGHCHQRQGGMWQLQK